MHNTEEYARIINLNQGEELLSCAAYANTFLKRLLGLMFRKKLSDGDGLILCPCKMVHTFGMKFTIDVIFVAKDNGVVHICNGMKPNTIGPFIADALYAIETSAGQGEKSNLKVGDQLKVVPYFANL